MRLRDVMTKNPITIESESLLLDARRMIKEKNIRRLPVVDKGKLVGIVTKKDLDEALPPPTSATSAYEFRSLSRMKVKEIMKKDPLTFTPNTLFEEALKIGQKNKISSFLVVDDNGKLVGITTESDIVRLLTRALGLEEEGSRITIEGLGRKLGGELQQIISIIDKNKTVLLSMLSLPRSEKNDWMIVLRVKTREPGPMVEDLKKAGFNVT